MSREPHLVFSSAPPVAAHSQSALVPSQTKSWGRARSRAERTRFGSEDAFAPPPPKRGIVSSGMSGFCCLASLSTHLYSPSSLLLFPREIFFVPVFCMGFPWLMSLLPASLFLVLCQSLPLAHAQLDHLGCNYSLMISFPPVPPQSGLTAASGRRVRRV